MLQGDIIPVTRNVVQFGQSYLNGDIVEMPDNLGIQHKHSVQDDGCLWHTCPRCGLLWDLPCEAGQCVEPGM